MLIDVHLCFSMLSRQATVFEVVALLLNIHEHL